VYLYKEPEQLLEMVAENVIATAYDPGGPDHASIGIRCCTPQYLDV
jgi:hypothetical protein